MFATRKQVFGWLILLLAAAGAAGTLGRRPLVRAPRDTGSATTGDHLIVAEQSLSPEQFRELVARVSRLSGGAEVRSYVENVGKVITASLSPIALEQVRVNSQTNSHFVELLHLALGKWVILAANCAGN